MAGIAARRLKARLTGAFAAWHVLTTPRAQVVVVANSKEQAEIIDRYAREVAMHPAVEADFEPRFRELRGPDGSRLVVKSADADKALGLTPTLALYDEYCAAKDERLYVALRIAALANRQTTAVGPVSFRDMALNRLSFTARHSAVRRTRRSLPTTLPLVLLG
jgi:hypothetical protein